MPQRTSMISLTAQLDLISPCKGQDRFNSCDVGSGLGMELR
jgi:hypothetical protein